MQSYTQLSMEERKQIYRFKQCGKLPSEIGKILLRNRSTIYRELKRNLKTSKHLYLPITVHGVSKARRRTRARTSKVNEFHLAWIIEKIKIQWSPDQISKRILLELNFKISHEWIYFYIYQNRLKGGDLYKNLRRGRRKRKKRIYVPRQSVRFKNAKSIELRPKIVENRERKGDWEGDLVVGAGNKRALVTMVDRVSLLTKIKKSETKFAYEVRGKIIKIFSELKCDKLTLTLDNGGEFADHETISKQTGLEIYFAHPYSSFERGTNENTNGLIRQYFPKKTDFSLVSDEDVQNAENILNHRPRKKLNYLTPYEVHYAIYPEFKGALKLKLEVA